MSWLVALAFVPSCVVGAVVACRLGRRDERSLVIAILLLLAPVLAAAVTVAAESGSVAARYLGLLAVLLGSVAIGSGFIAARRMDPKTGARPPRS